MKKLKKVFAVLLTLAMVLGMSMTTFAADNLKITVSGVTNKDATYTYVQLIEPDRTAVTGWKFTDNVTDAFKNEFKVEGQNNEDQDLIQRIINADAATLSKALAHITSAGTAFHDYSAKNETKVETEGLYKVNVGDTTRSWSPMAAYVGFETDQQQVTVVAKGQPKGVDKSSKEVENGTAIDASDKVVYIGKTVEYTITTTVPFFDPQTQAVNRTWSIKDTISGATFDGVTQDKKLSVTVTLGGGQSTPVDAVVSEDGSSFEVNLDSYVTDDSNANKSLTIVYRATVGASHVTNMAVPSYSGNPEDDPDKPQDELYAGSITITKTNEGGSETLSGATFKVYDPETKLYAVMRNNTVTGWTADKNASGTDTSETNDDGIVTVNGLEFGVEYKFIESKAPNGYKLDESPAELTMITSLPETLTENMSIGTAVKRDTTLSSLPETGGIGTTIFTIGGCAIMVIAAALFFASRRKSAK